MSVAWIKNRFTDLKYSQWLIKNCCRLCKDKYSLFPFFEYWILYTVPRLYFGPKKAIDLSQGVIKRFMNGNLILPLPLAGQIYYIAIRDSVDFDAFREICIEDHYNFSQIKPGMAVVDIGAHIGIFTILASKITGKQGRVVSVEPESRNFSQLKNNLQINKTENVTPVNTALGDFIGQRDFFVAKGSGCSSFFSDSGQEIVNKTETSVKTLDSLLGDLDIQKIDLIKIDAEGAELEILKGARQTLIKNPKMKIVIAAYHWPEEAAKTAEYLRSLKFSPEILPGIFTLVVVR